MVVRYRLRIYNRPSGGSMYMSPTSCVDYVQEQRCAFMRKLGNLHYLYNQSGYVIMSLSDSEIIDIIK